MAGLATPTLAPYCSDFDRERGGANRPCNILRVNYTRHKLVSRAILSRLTLVAFIFSSGHHSRPLPLRVPHSLCLSCVRRYSTPCQAPHASQTGLSISTWSSTTILSRSFTMFSGRSLKAGRALWSTYLGSFPTCMWTGINSEVASLLFCMHKCEKGFSGPSSHCVPPKGIEVRSNLALVSNCYLSNTFVHQAPVILIPLAVS